MIHLLPVDRLRSNATMAPHMRRYDLKGEYAVLWGQICRRKNGRWQMVGFVDDTKNKQAVMP